jgi:hypothetical protein
MAAASTIAPVGKDSGAGIMAGATTGVTTGAATARAMATVTGWAAIMRRAAGAMAIRAFPSGFS